MSNAWRLVRRLDAQLGPRIAERAPQLASGFVQQALDRAIRGAGPLDGASRGCDTEHSELVEDEPADVPARMRTPPVGNPLCAASVGIVALAGTRAGSRR